MGRKRKEKPSAETLHSTISLMSAPEYILSDFDIYGDKEYKEGWVIEMREKEGRIPEGYSDVVLMATVIR
jgi:hypothetical protein